LTIEFDYILSVAFLLQTGSGFFSLVAVQRKLIDQSAVLDYLNCGVRNDEMTCFNEIKIS